MVVVQVSLDPDGEVLLEADMNVGASLLQHSAVTTGKLGLKVGPVALMYRSAPPSSFEGITLC